MSRSQPTVSRSASYWSGVMPSHFCMMTVAMISSWWWCSGKSGLQGQRVAEHAAAWPAAGQRPDEVDGVDLDVLAVMAVAEGAAGRPVKHQGERLTVELRPFGHDVGDQPAVVVRPEVHRPARRVADVDPVAPHVAGEPHVQQVPQRPPANGRSERQRGEPHRRRGSPAALDRLRAGSLQLPDELRVGQLLALADLQLVQAVDPVMRIDLLVQRQPPAQLVRELRHRGLRVGRAEHVQSDLADVPRGAVGRHRPLLRGERGGQFREALELVPGEAAGFRPADTFSVHADTFSVHWVVPLAMTSSTSRSTRRLRCRSQRSPPGSLLICASVTPAVMATMQSMSPCSVTPAARISVYAPPSTFSASAYDSAEGVKPGMGRWNSSSYSSLSSLPNAANACSHCLSASRGSGENVTASRRSRSRRLPSANIASYSASLDSKYTYSEGWRIPTTRARPCSVTPAIPSARASAQAAATISAVFSARRLATEFAIVSRSGRQRPVCPQREGGRPPAHRRSPSPAGHPQGGPQGEPLGSAGPGGHRRDQPAALRLGQPVRVPAVRP